MKFPGKALQNVFSKGAFGKGPDPLKPTGGKDSLKALIEDGKNKTLLTRSETK